MPILSFGEGKEVFLGFMDAIVDNSPFFVLKKTDWFILFIFALLEMLK